MEATNAHLQSARAHIDRLEWSDAQDSVSKSLQSSPDYAPSYELLGEILVEQGDSRNAIIAFQKAIELDQTPGILSNSSHAKGSVEEAGYSKYLWMAQLSEEGGEQSLQYYQSGIDILTRLVASAFSSSCSSSTKSASDDGLKTKLASAYCGMAELYMTDLCMTDRAEQNCDMYVTRALLTDENSVEALQTLASMRLSQNRTEEAKTALLRSLDLWYLPLEHEQEDTNAIKRVVDGKKPAYASRMSLVRLLLESGLDEEAISVLQTLADEDEEMVDLWYLYGWACYLRAKSPESDVKIDGNGTKDDRRRSNVVSAEESRTWMVESRAHLRRCEALYKRLEWDDEGIRDHANELLALINDHIGEERSEEVDPVGENDMTAEDWESGSDSEMEQ